MFTCEDLVQPTSVAEAYRLLGERPDNTLIGGGAFLRIGGKKIGTAIDLSRLGLDYIRETDGWFELGAMATFRAVETYRPFRECFGGLLPQAVGNVIGVQFRNLVTVGASVYAKFGFSDLITALLVLETEVELYKGGRLPLGEFLARPFPRDILTRLYIARDGRRAAYRSLRNSASDFPLINAAASCHEGRWLIAVGARPLKAEIARTASAAMGEPGAEPAAVAAMAADELAFSGNNKASAAYRKAMAAVMVKRAVEGVLACD